MLPKVFLEEKLLFFVEGEDGPPAADSLNAIKRDFKERSSIAWWMGRYRLKDKQDEDEQSIM